ncbi:hypothetical protein [Saezia sanguinis]|jgi:hypothetical protein|uniref:hypothetical protein n=1 Tax=Saezia sanguinis TaxID=1965230 RepID=UPI000F8DE638|nr:hypothetical protein [Saezia sanguinis]
MNRAEAQAQAILTPAGPNGFDLFVIAEHDSLAPENVMNKNKKPGRLKANRVPQKFAELQKAFNTAFRTTDTSGY